MQVSALKTLNQVYAHNSLIRYLVLSDLKLTYENLVLGYLWWILTPLMWLIVYWLLVVGIFNLGEPNYPLFLFCAILPWQAFVASIGQSMSSISGQEKLIKQLAFPKAVLPIAVVLSNTVKLVTGLPILVVAAMLFGLPLTGYVFLLPVIALVQVIFTTGLAFMFSILAIYFADVQNIMQFVMRIWLYLSPGLYAIERVPLRFRHIYMLNPFAAIFTSYRDVIMYGRPPEWGWLAVAGSVALVTLMLGFWFFASQERNLSKVI